jgi:peptidoglycan/LPS O-acetylase OafA/YrhL
MLFTTNLISEYLLNPRTLRFLFKNSTLFFDVQYDLPGVFKNLPYKNIVNGSLWTLPIEVRMYTYLAIIGSICVYSKKWFGKNLTKIVFLSIAIIALAAHIINHFESYTSNPFFRLFSMFFIGTAFYVYRSKIIISYKVAMISIVALVLSTNHKDLFFVIYVICLPYLVFFFAYTPSGKLKYFNRAGDYSYGIYIYAFPVQQSISATLPSISVHSLMFISLIITFVLAYLSWHFIEKKCLKFKDNYIWIERLLHNLRVSLSCYKSK